ncbi:endopeptidase [Trichosporon asahii var. asahii CBS 8904]|uniref:Endopeptidase n=1 Tax=Trichosporon asahii var. asahii (strain CBS 8904) TaxID=1220162 RepID=K1VWI8_TRIAC|nr:endopeptidase [Trichosporon asahii var. asahii CBS 8904]
MYVLIVLTILTTLSVAASETSGGVTLPLRRHARPRPQTLSSHHALLEAHIRTSHGLERRHLESELESYLSRSSSTLAKRNGTTSTDAKNWGYVYTVPVSLGTRPQLHEVIFDTGSDALWVWGAPPFCNTSACTAVPGYDASKSSTTAKAEYERELSVAYSDASEAEGEFVRDVVGIGSISFPYDFGLAKTANMQYWVNTTTVGIMGAQRVAVKNGDKPWEVVTDEKAEVWWVEGWKKGHLAENLIGVEMSNPDHDGLEVQRNHSSPGGKLTIGGVDKAAFEGELHWVPVVPWSPQQWKVKLDGVAGPNGTVHKLENCTTLIDTGNTNVILPQVVLDPAILSIPGAKHVANGKKYGIPCNTTESISLVYGGKPFRLEPSKFLGKKLTGVGVEGLCLAKIDPNPEVQTAGVVGEWFFHNVYHAYRIEPAAVGFAPYKPGH